MITNLKIHSGWQRRFLAFISDYFAIPFAWFGAYWLRFNLELLPDFYMLQALTLLPYLLVVQSCAYIIFGLYRGIWRFASLPDLLRIVKAVLAASIILLTALFFINRTSSVPRSIFPLYSLLLIFLLGGSRLLYRGLRQHITRFATAKRVLIVGAGQAGEGLVRDLLRSSHSDFRPIVFVDDDTKKMGQELHGVRVVAQCMQIPEIVTQYRIELILIALPSVSSADMRRIVDYCNQSGVEFRTLPSLTDLALGNVSISTLRAVSIEDLLGRDQVTLDWAGIQKGISGKTVLVTGGGGSIGSELCRQIAQHLPQQLIAIEHSEFNLYQLEMELQQLYPALSFKGQLINICDQTAIEHIFKTFKPDIVFHAAAYKHVPLLELQLRTAVQNNVLGTKILAEAAIAHHVKTFVLISTDKAVNPSNILGATKRAAEIICQNYNQHGITQFITVRFGNVLNSAGSVIPLFRKQIAAGGPVTVTDPEITRFFMTIPEATQLIMQAMIMGKGGEIFVLDMGEPVKIRFLAEQLIRLSGLVLDKDITIEYTGLRPGEKLYEELFHAQERLIYTGHHKILQAQSREFDNNALQIILATMDIACTDYNETTLRQALIKLVPEYQASHAI